MTNAALSQPQAQPQVFSQPSQLTLIARYLRRNKSLAFGLLMLLGLVAFTAIGMLIIDQDHAYPLAVKSKQPPGLEFPLGTDFFGRACVCAFNAVYMPVYELRSFYHYCFYSSRLRNFKYSI